MDDTTTNYIVAGIFGLLASVATYFATRKKTKAESADLLIDAAVKLVDSYEKRIRTLEDEVSELRKEYKDLLKTNISVLEENKSLKDEVIRLEKIIYNKGDIDK
jgi:LPXTG-motif cell wall-anchored protein